MLKSLRGILCRHMTQDDLPDVLQAEYTSNCYPWLAQDFFASMASGRAWGVAAEIEETERLAGHCVFEAHCGALLITTFCVAPAYQRMGVGTCIVLQLVRTLRRDHFGRNRLTVSVPEQDLARQLFFKRCGFVAIATVRGYRDDKGLTRYLMQLKL